MSDEQKIEQADLVKALGALQDLAKGHSSRGTATTKVEGMSGEGGASQVHHTAGNSDPGSWAGTGQRPAGENGASDAVDENGTDYKGGAEMAKSILDKLSKGHALNAEEFEFVNKGGLENFKNKKDDDKDDKDPKDKKDNPFGKSAEGVDKAYDDDKDKDKDMDKSLAEAAQANETVREGMEVSEFLAEFVGVVNKSLESLESRIGERVVAAVVAEAAKNEEFNKSLAGALSNFGEALSANAQRVDQIESTPARGPKSQQVSAVNKSFTPGGEGEELSKSQVAATMVDMVEKGKIDVETVVRFDSTGQLGDDVMAKVLSHRNGN